MGWGWDSAEEGAPCCSGFFPLLFLLLRLQKLADNHRCEKVFGSARKLEQGGIQPNTNTMVRGLGLVPKEHGGCFALALCSSIFSLSPLSGMGELT